MSDAPDIVERLHDEADQCRQDSADDIARLLVSAAGEILKLRAALAQPAPQAAPTAPEWQAIETAPDGVMLLFADMRAAEARYWIFCGWRHNGLRRNSVQMPDNTSRSATHWQPLPAAPQEPQR